MIRATLRGLLDAYALDHPQLEAGTLAQYGYAVGSLERFCGRTVSLADLGDDLFKRWLFARLRERSPKTRQGFSNYQSNASVGPGGARYGSAGHGTAARGKARFLLGG